MEIKMIEEIKTSEEFSECLDALYRVVFGLINSKGIFHDTALFGFLTSALSVLAMAELHVKEFKFDDDEIVH